MDDLVLVRWLGTPVLMGSRRLRFGDTFQMPRAEAEARPDVEIVEPDPVTIVPPALPPLALSEED